MQSILHDVQSVGGMEMSVKNKNKKSIAEEIASLQCCRDPLGLEMSAFFNMPNDNHILSGCSLSKRLILDILDSLKGHTLLNGQGRGVVQEEGEDKAKRKADRSRYRPSPFLQEK